MSYYMDTGDGTTYNMSNHFNESVFNSSNYTVFGSYNIYIFLYSHKSIYCINLIKTG